MVVAPRRGDPKAPEARASPELAGTLPGPVVGLRESPDVGPVRVPAIEQMARAVLNHDGAPGRPTEIRLRLDPPELGMVRIHIRATEGGITAHVVVHEEATRQLLESQLHQLQRRLEAAGVALGRFDISREGAGHGGHSRHDFGQRFLPEEDALPAPGRVGSAPRKGPPRAGRLDVVA